MRVVKKINKRENCEYLLTPTGDIFEIEKRVRKIDKIKLDKGKKYHINSKGEVIEKEVVKLRWDEFFEYKKNGRLAQIFREGKEIEIEDETTSFENLEKYEDDFISESLKGRKIEDVKISRKKGNKKVEILLDNGKKITISEGLLTGSSSFEIE